MFFLLKNKFKGYKMYYSNENDRYVPDTSAIVEGFITQIAKDDYIHVIIPEAVVAELEYQSNKNRPTGLIGLREIQKLQKLASHGKINLEFTGKRPSNYEISLAKTGEIDANIRDIARSELAILVTCDKVQAETAKALGICVKYYKQETKEDMSLTIDDYFDDETMSVHLKENVKPFAKVGLPGHIKLVELQEEPTSYYQLEKIASEILEKERYDPKTYLEADLEGAIVVQSREYRISINRPPFSEAMEITAVRPVADVSLEDYSLSDKLMERLKDDARGILISGSPGAGKSTFAQAVAEFFADNGKIVKTMESPRDLQVPDEITQYSPLEGDMEKTADILLLVRPDFTIYDELRKNHDFSIFADMRLAGVGMIGVVHATKPIDGIQRIANRVELGIIPSIVDTTIYIEDGQIKKVLETNLIVKVPSGMVEADLARPVIEVRDFETNKLLNEIYTYGEQTIVMDLELINKDEEENKSAVDVLAEKEVIRQMKRIIPKSNILAEVVSPERINIYIEEKFIPKVIGKSGKRIADIEKKIGISMGVEAIELIYNNDPFIVPYTETRKHIILEFPNDSVGRAYDLMINNEYLFTATVGKHNEIKLKKGLEITDILMEAIECNLPITAIRKN